MERGDAGEAAEETPQQCRVRDHQAMAMGLARKREHMRTVRVPLTSPDKGVRFEWLQLAYDKTLDPGTAFHLEVPDHAAQRPRGTVTRERHSHAREFGGIGGLAGDQL